MQNPSKTMLDSVLDGLLSEKQTDHPGKDKTCSTDEGESKSAPPEAEVRLVVKFIVEEHIVYRGKVEKINQLESEELSRVVSRVVWDGTNINDRLESGSSKSKTCPDNQQDSTFDVESTRVGSDSTEIVDIDPSDSTDIELQDKTDLHGNPSSKNVQGAQTSGNTPDSPKHGASAENCLQEPANTITTAQISALQTQRSESASECDIHLPQSSVEARHVEDSLQNLEDDNTASRGGEEFHGLDEINTNSITIEEANAEKLSIADLLNDCLDDIDSESRNESIEDSYSSPATLSVKQNYLEEDQTTAQSSTPDTMTVGSDDQDDSPLDSKENGKFTNYSRRSALVDTDVVKVITENSTNKINDLEQKLTSSMFEEFSHHEIVPTLDTPEMSEFTPSSTPVTLTPSRCNETSSASGKRKSSVERHAPLGKRVRRTSSKERSTRNNTGRNSDLNRQDDITASKLAPSTISLLANNQPYRQNKVFAKWSDNHFYPGTILKPAKDRKLVIVFFDGAQRNVPEADLIPLNSIEGKRVRVSIAKNYCVNAIVHDQHSSGNDQPMFDVEYQQDGIVRKCVPLKDIFLTAEQGTPLINQIDRAPGASNFADVDLDNIIYEKRSRRIQEMEEFYLTSTSPHRTKTSLLL